MKKTVILFLLISMNLKGYSQQNDTQAALYNVGLGSIFGGIGAVINKKSNEKFGKVFLKGMYQGAFGGYLVFESKRMIRDFSKTNNYNYVWPSKLLNAAGNSIIENASSNKNFWEKWHLHIGFNRVEFETNGKFKINYKVMPFALYGTIYGASQGKLDFNTSLKTGTLIFTSHKIKGGVTYVNSILIEKNDLRNILAHELIHTYQYEDFMTINTFTNKLKYNWKEKSKFIKNIDKWIYFDSHSLVLKSLYELENINQKCYYDNYFEHEANYYSNRFDCEYK